MTTDRSSFEYGFIFTITKPGDVYAPRISSHPIYRATPDDAKAELERKFKPTCGYVITLERTMVR